MASGQRRPSRSAEEARRLPDRPAARELVPSHPGLSGRWHMHDVPSRYSRWNYHPEYEVHLIRSGTGRYVIGDRIDTFVAGQLVLVGSNLPHHWISDLEPGDVIHDRDVVFQFHPDWIRQCQAVLPELSGISPVLKKSAQGIEFTGAAAERGAVELQQIGVTAGPERLWHIFALFDVFASAPVAEQRTLAKAWLPPLDDQYGGEIIDRVFGYMLDNLAGEVSMSTAADLIGMSHSAFSRYFKRMSGQTFTDTVRKLRLAHACKLLKDSDLPIASICTRVGYTNLSNFNRQFRAQHGLTPREFRRDNR
jgi:AraC-like DNA-binding protein/mannose-6-phosphate isomerase-like protein (cupin superfamily)